MNKFDWRGSPFALEQHYPDGMTVWITLIETPQGNPVSVVRDVQWSGKVVALPINQLQRWNILNPNYHSQVFMLGRYRLRIVDRDYPAFSVICVRDNVLWWWLPMKSWVRRQGNLIRWRMLLTFKVWNLVDDIDTNKPLDEQRLYWLPAWRKGRKSDAS